MKYPIPSYSGDCDLSADRLERFMTHKGLGVEETAILFNVSTDCIESILNAESSLESTDFLEKFMDVSGFIEI